MNQPSTTEEVYHTTRIMNNTTALILSKIEKVIKCRIIKKNKHMTNMEEVIGKRMKLNYKRIIVGKKKIPSILYNKENKESNI